MPRYSIFDPETALCEYSRKCDSPAIKSSGGPCAACEPAFKAKKAAKAAKAKLTRAEMKDLADGLGLTMVRGAVSGKIYFE